MDVATDDGFSTSDHDKVCFTIYLNVTKERQHGERFGFYDFTKADYEQIALALSQVDWGCLYTVSPPDAL